MGARENFHLKIVEFKYKIDFVSVKSPHRLAVRTSDSHSGNTGSIPVGGAIRFRLRYSEIKGASELGILVMQTSHPLSLTLQRD